MKSGFLLVDKPVDWTSFDVVGYLRGVTKIKKIGHAGTLDPFATGLLIVAVGRESTKRIDEFKDMRKVYETTIVLGAHTDTYDKTGTITPHEYVSIPSSDVLKDALSHFEGSIKQVPPMFSAKKVKGKKLYELARKGIEIERQPNDVQVHSIELLNYSFPRVTLRITCGPGTYIRSIAHDLGEKLGIGGYCEELRRTAIGSYRVSDAHDPKWFERDTFETHFVS